MPSGARHLTTTIERKPCHCEPTIEGNARNDSRTTLYYGVISRKDAKVQRRGVISRKDAKALSNAERSEKSVERPCISTKKSEAVSL